jgi:hypothetical protein
MLGSVNTGVLGPSILGEGAHLSINVIRTAERWYVQRGGEAFTVAADLPSTAALLGEGLEAVRAASSAVVGGVPVDQLSLRETGQRADGQFKVLRLTSDPSFAAEFAAERDLVGSERTSA